MAQMDIDLNSPKTRILKKKQNQKHSSSKHAYSCNAALTLLTQGFLDKVNIIPLTSQQEGKAKLFCTWSGESVAPSGIDRP